MEKLMERFLRYVKIDTESDPNSSTFPSTEKQYVLARMLKDELIGMGILDAQVDEEFGYVYATLPSNLTAEEDAKTPVLGFIAHMDTAPAFSGKDVKPRIVENYDGSDIVLNEELKIVLSPSDYPQMKDCIGKTLIVTDGTTLLGADDKAGVSEIMTAVEELIAHPERPHGKIRIAFTPDEEVGAGMDHFDVERFGADYAYTVDGGVEGELEYETFNAAGASITIHGKSIHPGSSKNHMVNACILAGEFNALLPAVERPEHTEGYEGFYHLNHMSGNVELTKLHYIIRDHDMEKFEAKKKTMQAAADFMNARYGAGTVDCDVKDSYYNMKEKILPHFHLIENAKKAMTELGITPSVNPVRGGTDGCRLSYMGVPCPNLYTGGANSHGRYEYVCYESMKSMVEVLQKIAGIYAGK